MLAKGGAIIYPTIFVDDSDIRPPQGQDIGSDRFLTPLEAMRQRAESDAGTHGYYLNSDPDFLGSLLGGLKTNEERYGYSSCLCRLTSRAFDSNRDIVCPCDYQNPDVEEYGCCHCGLYVTKDIFEGTVPLQPTPERRPPEKAERAYSTDAREQSR